MDLLYFLKIFLKRKWLILGLTFLAMFVTLVFKIFQKPLYESKAQYSTGFTIDRVRLSDANSVADLYAADTKFDNVIETFKSPRVIGMISYKLLAHDLENPGSAYHHLTKKEKESKEFKAINIDTTIKILNKKISDNDILRSDVPIERNIIEFLKLYKYDYYSIRNQLIITRVNRTDYLDIVYRSENPYLSAWIVNAMGNEFINYYKNLNFQRSNENISGIRDLERGQQAKIDSLNNALLAEKISQGSIDPASVSASAMETVKDLEGKYADEKSTYELNSNRITILTKQIESLTSKEGNVNTDKTDLVNLINEKNKLEAQLYAKGGTDQLLEQQINSLREKIRIKSTGGGVTNGKIADRIADLQNQINEATALKNASMSTMSDYQSRINYYKGLTRINPGSGVKMEVIQSKLDVEQKQLSNLKEKLNQAEGLSKDDPSSNFTQTLIGQPAVEPEPKKIITTTGISGASMFFLACFTLLFIEIFNSSIRTPYGFEKTVDMTLKGIVNMIKLKPGGISDIILNENRLKKPEENMFRNNIRKLRYELVNTDQKVFLFTSSGEKVGKSLLIEALAYSLILIKKRVLIIDFNLHNNSLTRKFNVDATLQYLSEKVKMKLPITSQAFTSKTDQDLIQIIGCEESVASPSEVLFRFDFEDFLRLLKESYDYILIESPALNKYSDTKELTAYADKVINVFSADQIISHADRVSIEFMNKLENKNMGAVLNKVLVENINY